MECCISKERYGKIKAYRIKNWDENYEVAQSRKCKAMSWVAIPNSHEGNSYLDIAEHEKSVEIFCAWILLVQLASRAPLERRNGLLVSGKGKPLTAKRIAVITQYPAEIFTLAFEVLCGDDIGWLERIEL